MNTTIKLDASVVIWPGNPPEVFCWFKATIEEIATMFHAPMFERDGFRYVLLVHPSLGLLAIDEGDISLNEGNLDVYFDTDTPYLKAKEEFPPFLGEQFVITWPYREQPSFSK